MNFSKINLNSSEYGTIVTIITIFSLLSFLIISISYNTNLKSYDLCGENEICLYNLILDTKNVSLCDFSQDKNICYKQVAMDFKNSTLCNYTNNHSNCKLNLAIKFQDTSICTSLNLNKNLTEYSTSLIDNCYFQISTHTLNQTTCDLANDVSRCYYSYALFINDSNICNKTNKYENLCLEKLESLSK